MNKKTTYIEKVGSSAFLEATQDQSKTYHYPLVRNNPTIDLMAATGYTRINEREFDDIRKKVKKFDFEKFGLTNARKKR